ncbi:hypothetical protein [Paenibacillus sp. Y412MC10]|uniref:hypothetical protein n=1 Tax=Geobacillus sp. (strain Y412MC10) TaxID=481743 RepID=UPI001642D06F|nr:hypothetical protein [Paenibacillus sp. Y412MC10]
MVTGMRSPAKGSVFFVCAPGLPAVPGIVHEEQLVKAAYSQAARFWDVHLLQ